MTLRVITGADEGGTMTGRELLAELAPTIERHLHRVPPDDPWRAAFQRLLTSAPATPPGAA